MDRLKLNSFSKVVIIGTSGAGKTTLAKALANKYEISDIELDNLFWEPQWTEATPEVFKARVQNATMDRGWVVHGNYNKVRDLIWHKADVIIWLDYPRHIVFWRVLKRSLQRAYHQTPVCNGNKESFRLTFLSKDSIILWALRTYKLRKKEFSAFMKDPAYSHKMLRISHPREVKALLS